MPFTPFHMGPGLLIKAVMQGSFSLMVFGWAQILMDIQPLIAMTSSQGKVHGFSHTWLGAIFIGFVAALSGKYLSQYGLKILEIPVKGATNIKWTVCFISAFIGSFSHILLDSIMHSDMSPGYPVTESNLLLGIISVYTLHLSCFLAGVLGGIVYFVVVKWKSDN